MSQFPPQSCGDCPHLAHFEKSQDPKYYMPNRTVPRPDVEIQKAPDLKGQLGATQTYNPPSLSAPPIKPTTCEAPCAQVDHHQEERNAQDGPRFPGMQAEENALPQAQPQHDPTLGIHPNERPPCYMPQPEDSLLITDLGKMEPIGPWATGRIDWGPMKALTGTRPVVDRYSISRYSEGEWRQHNKDILKGRPYNAIEKSKLIEWNGKQCIKQTQADADKNQGDMTKRLNQKEREVHRWKCELERAIAASAEELILLEELRKRLKTASSILQVPEAIVGESLDIRTSRMDSELVRDEVEVELIKERALCNEIRDHFTRVMKDVEDQLEENKTSKRRLEMDWTDKKQSFQLLDNARTLNLRSSVLLFRPGSIIFPGEQSTPEFWDLFIKEILKRAEATRQKSIVLRGSLDNVLKNAARDLHTQADVVNVALKKRTQCVQAVLDQLESELKKTLQRLVDTERLVNDLKAATRRIDLCMKKAQTRLHLLLQRERVENCRDDCHFGLIEEVKTIGEQASVLLAQLKQAQQNLIDLVDGRIELENEIMKKRKSLEIDVVRIQTYRTYYPSITALSGFV